MSKTIPFYKDHEARHRADACDELMRAALTGAIRVEMMSGGHYPGKPVLAQGFPGLKMLGLWDASSSQSWGLPWHRNEGIELTFLERGNLSFLTDEGEFSLRPNDLTIMRPWQQHRLGNPAIEASRLHWLLLDLGVRRPHQPWKWPDWIQLSSNDLEELTLLLSQNERPVWKASSDLLRIFQSIAQCIESDVNGSSFSWLRLRLNELFLVLLEMLRKKDVRLDKSLTSSMRSAHLFLEDLRRNPETLILPWTVERMAHVCGLGVTQFTRHVKHLTNMTPLHYLNHHRMTLAAELLSQRRNMSITAIAQECGFSSSQYFSTVFLQRHGCSPRVYRAQLA